MSWNPGGVAALVQYLEGAKSAGSRSYVNCAWALANLAAHSPPNQVHLISVPITLKHAGYQVAAGLHQCSHLLLVLISTAGAV